MTDPLKITPTIVKNVINSASENGYRVRFNADGSIDVFPRNAGAKNEQLVTHDTLEQDEALKKFRDSRNAGGKIVRYPHGK